MTTGTIPRLTAGLALLSLAACGARLASAAGIADLQSPYALEIFQVNHSRAFNDELALAGAGPGTVTGSFAAIPVTGKLNNQGKLTFNGAGEVKITNGKGQLSATGRYILGSFKVTKSNNPNDLGTYLFRAETETSPTVLGIGTHAAVNPGLATEYLGNYHDNAISASEDEDLDFANVQESANGKFTADMLGVHVTGKRTGTKVTFKGKQSGQLGSLKLEGSGTLDFTHLAFIGKLTKTATGNFLSGKGTFELYAGAG